MNFLKKSYFHHCLYITYDGLLDPLGKTQVLPYILGIAEAGFRFTILSYEKSDRDPAQLRQMADFLHSKNITWIRLPFVYGRFQGLLRIFRGASELRKIENQDPIAFAHMRAIIPAVIYRLAMIRKPFIYDIRSFLGQWVDVGRLGAKSFSYKILSWFEDWLIRNASGLVVLDQSGFQYLLDNYKLRSTVNVIPTSTDLRSSFTSVCPIEHDSSTLIRFVFLGGARFPYLPIDAFRFVLSLINYGFDCTIDFINERDHELIENACTLSAFPRERFRLFSLSPEHVEERLPLYDCGLVFVANGPWLSMSSPTKIGEYLASGLHLVGLEGISVLDRLAAQSSCVDVLKRNDNSESCYLSTFQHAFKLIERIKSPGRSSQARILAEKYYDRQKAVSKYIDLYHSVLSQG